MSQRNYFAVINENMTICAIEMQVSGPFDEGLMLLAIDAGDYYEFDKIGAMIWMKIQQKMQVKTLIEQLAKEFETDGRKIAFGLIPFLDGLHRFALIEIH